MKGHKNKEDAAGWYLIPGLVGWYLVHINEDKPRSARNGIESLSALLLSLLPLTKN